MAGYFGKVFLVVSLVALVVLVLISIGFYTGILHIQTIEWLPWIYEKNFFVFGHKVWSSGMYSTL